ncbi:hypothetical protein G7046_g4310 [Stylonectria norvegica]|nr:hypothetical protein G7046_g4310 [Stylonectria norvegica]
MPRLSRVRLSVWATHQEPLQHGSKKTVGQSRRPPYLAVVILYRALINLSEIRGRGTSKQVTEGPPGRQSGTRHHHPANMIMFHAISGGQCPPDSTALPSSILRPGGEVEPNGKRTAAGRRVEHWHRRRPWMVQAALVSCSTNPEPEVIASPRYLGDLVSSSRFHVPVLVLGT